MKIKTEQDMKEFCKHVNTVYKPTFSINYQDILSNSEVQEWEDRRRQYDNFPGAELKQGIDSVLFKEEGILLLEKPLIHPYATAPSTLKGPMTGVLVNCIDKRDKTILLQLRGKGLDAGEYKFQGAAAGFGKFRTTLYQTALKELFEEPKISNPNSLFGNKVTAFFPFMVMEYPQPLANFIFEYMLSNFQLCQNMDSILRFRESIISDINARKRKKEEGYHFRVPINSLESISSQIDEQKRFHGPIYDSLISTLKTLKDSRII